MFIVTYTLCMLLSVLVWQILDHYYNEQCYNSIFATTQLNNNINNHNINNHNINSNNIKNSNDLESGLYYHIIHLTDD
jgi:hypothetical protein